jgi:ribosomal protein S18 acetylase RimI-like enzyme
MRIRSAVGEDAQTLAPLMREFNAVEAIAWRPDAVAGAFARLCADSSLGFALVAEDEGAVAGYVVVTYNYDLEFAGRDGFVTELFVVRERRGHGLGRALLAAAEAHARGEGAQALHLLVQPDNHVAQALYRRAGFAVTPRVMMTKLLR